MVVLWCRNSDPVVKSGDVLLAELVRGRRKNLGVLPSQGLERA